MTDEQRKSLEPLRQGVFESLPELELIADEELRNKCVDAWALALSETEFESIDQIRGSGNWDTPAMKGSRTQATHLRAVTMMAVGMAKALEEIVGSLGVDYDVLVAAGLCHDVGKPFEFSPRNHARWSEQPQTAGRPSMRHPVYGTHIALTAGLPEAVVNAVGGHSREGEFIQRSLETMLVHTGDKGFWHIMTIAGQMDSDDTSYLEF